MVQLAAMIACQAVSEYRVMLGAALQVGVTPVEAKEIVYQAVPYVGMAKVFDFLHATNEVLRVLLDTITQLLPFIGYPRTLNAIRVINDGTSR
jgi:alkylhydroperoxidase/carboxymuconolactone decarboxylase family protein YurZ